MGWRKNYYPSSKTNPPTSASATASTTTLTTTIHLKRLGLMVSSAFIYFPDNTQFLVKILGK